MNNPYFNVPEEDVITTTVISVENDDGSYTLYDNGIVSSSMSLSRILCSSGLNFGETNSAKFEFQMYDIPDITNRFIKVLRTQKYNDSVVQAPVFTGYVDSFKSEIDSAIKTIITYDVWYFKKDSNIAGWIDEFLNDYRDDYLTYTTESQYYNGVTLSQLQEHLFTYFNIPYETLDNDFIVVPPLTAFGQSTSEINTVLSGLKSTILNFNTLGEIVFAINEVNASFGYIDPDGNYVHKKLQNTFDELNPAKWDLDTTDIDSSGADIDFNNIIPSIDMVKYTDSSGSTLTMGDTKGSVIYELSSNPLLAYHTTTFTNQWRLSTLWINSYQQRLYNIYTEITNVTYYVGSIPLKLSSPPTDKGISLGDSISVYLREDITGIMYAMQLDYSGSQLYDETISTTANTASADTSTPTSSPPVSSEGGSSDYASFAGTSTYAKKLKNPVSIDGINFDGSQSITHYGVCDTEVSVSTKIITTDYDFALEKGAIIKFLTKNPIADITFIALNVNGTGAKGLLQYGSLGLSKIYIEAYSMVECVYDGNYWRLLSMVYREATTSYNGLMTSTDKTKLNGIATGAEVNQYAFSNISASGSTIAADSKTDTLSLEGSNVTLTADEDNDKLTIGITKNNVTNALGYTPYTPNEIDNKFSALETNIDWKEAVDTFDDIATTYPDPVDGWTVNVKDTDYTYRYNGTEWVPISANAIPKVTSEVDGILAKEDYADFKDANDKKHTHSNKSVLDKITQTLIDAWNSAVTHISDTVKHITSTERANWDTAYKYSQEEHAPVNAQENVIETVKVNGTALIPVDKAVNVAVPTKVSELTNDSNYQTSTDVSNAINDIEIGGRNLIKDTSNPITVDASDSTNNYIYKKLTPTIVPLISGSPYTVSFDVEFAVGSDTAIGVRFFNSAITINYGNVQAPIVDGHVSTTIILTGPAEVLLLYAGQFGTTSGKKVIISNLKLEKGNKAADWTPAPEDIENTYATKTELEDSFSELGSAAYTDSSAYAMASHTHNYADSSSAGGSATSAVKLETARKIQVNLASTSSASFDGSGDVAPGVTGTLPVSNGGTGATTAKKAEYNLLSGMTEASDAIEDTSQFAFANVYPSTTSGRLHFRKATLLWNYIKSKISSVLGLTASSYGGNSNTATKLATARTIDGVSFDGSSNITHYGICDTASSTVTKVVSVDSGFTLVTGATIKVKMTYANLISVPLLNVNGTGAKTIKYTSNNNSAITWEAGSILEFVYDGTYWILTNVHHIATTSEKGFMSATDKTKLDDLKLIEFVNVNLGSHTFSASTGSSNITVDVSSSIPEGYTLVAAIPKGTGNNNLYYYWMGVTSSTTIQYQCRNVSTSTQTGTQYCQIICVKQ